MMKYWNGLTSTAFINRTKNLLDQAVLDHAEVHNLMKADELYLKVDEILSILKEEECLLF